MKAGVLVVDGYGLRLHVERGHLVIDDGVGRSRRQTRLPRSQRDISRIVIHGHHGEITLDAVRWCADVGLPVVQLDRDGRLLMLAATPSRNDGRLFRAQAAAPTNPVGVDIARYLLQLKITGQADNARTHLRLPDTARTLAAQTQKLAATSNLAALRDIEATAANVYFTAWVGIVECRFIRRDTPLVPAHWGQFTARSSPLHRGGRSPRKAADPLNAALNYGYTLAETESRIAALTLGLEPTLGILHTDQKSRDGFVLDLMEAARPIVERYVLTLTGDRRFTRDDVYETPDGQCRLADPFAAELAADLLPDVKRAVAAPAETIARMLADSSHAVVRTATPLSRHNMTGAQLRGARSGNPKPAAPTAPRRTCQGCGDDLYGSARKYCPACWSVTRKEYMRQLGKDRAGPPKVAKPTVEELSGGWTLQDYQTRILPALAASSLLDMERATGMCNASCSRVRRGLQVPNPRHWTALARLAGLTP